MKKFFLFDLDGTLTDTGPGIMGSVQNALGRLGWPPQKDEFLRQFVGPPLTESFQRFCGMDPESAEHAIQLYRERYNEWGMYQSPLYPGVDGMLERLSQAVTLAVATSKRDIGARRIMEMRGIDGYFQAVVGDDGTRPSKAAVIRDVLELLGGPPAEQVVMVGDRSYDIAGAHACGIEAIGVGYGYAPAGELTEAEADWQVDTVVELEALCMKLGAV